jgi:hypothetical protein
MLPRYEKGWFTKTGSGQTQHQNTSRFFFSSHLQSEECRLRCPANLLDLRLGVLLCLLDCRLRFEQIGLKVLNRLGPAEEENNGSVFVSFLMSVCFVFSRACLGKSSVRWLQ